MYMDQQRCVVGIILLSIQSPWVGGGKHDRHCFSSFFLLSSTDSSLLANTLLFLRDHLWEMPTVLGSASLMSNNIFLELNKMNNPSFIEKVPHRVVE